MIFGLNSANIGLLEFKEAGAAGSGGRQRPRG
jgi:hypothetical protein